MNTALITGAGGQLGRALEMLAPSSWTITSLRRAELDVGDRAAVETVVGVLRPDLIFNAAAYTAVDRAELEPEIVFRINAEGPGHLAVAAAKVGARMIHVSTDYVFDGRSGVAYRPDDPTAPLGVYGASKLAGEAAVAAAGSHHLTVRTAWLYSGHGVNFMTTMLRLMNTTPEVRVVADQIGAPTGTPSLAAALWELATGVAEGVLHFTAAGVASWYDFAQAIAEEAERYRLAPAGFRVVPIGASDYPTAARRPAFSVLDGTATWSHLGNPPRHWRVGLRGVLAGMTARDG